MWWTRPGGAVSRQRYFTMVFLYYVVHWYRGVGRNIELNIMVVEMCWKYILQKYEKDIVYFI